MRFPKRKMRFTAHYQGDTDPEGWIVLDIANTDLDGVSKLYLSLSDIQQVREGGDLAEERLRQARALLGGIGSGEEA
ncbi:MAG: hypothetical protein RMJ43_11255 [Chloroherpetonaceae bacterium]|nr:hypothetical protein [Chthonomonadaceae bacterium]MDW8208406.1 hypothetical protein [Chloroherpetonaceae bacterium]